MAEKPRRKRYIILIILMVIVLTLVILYIDSNIRIVTTEYHIYHSNLPEAFDGYRIVVLADVHGKEFGRNNDRLVATVIGNNNIHVDDIISKTKLPAHQVLTALTMLEINGCAISDNNKYFRLTNP